MISRNQFGLILFQGSNILVPWIILIYCTTNLGSDIYGWYIYNYSIFSLLAFFINLGTSSSILAISEKHAFTEYALFSSVIIIKLISATLIFSVIYILSILTNIAFIININPYFAFLIVYEIMCSDWIFYKKNKLLEYGLFYAVLRFLPLFGLIGAKNLDTYLFTCLLLSILLGAIIMYRTKPEKKDFSLKILQNISSKIIRFFPNFFFGKIRLLGGKIILGGTEQLNDLVYYDLGEKLKNLSNVPTQIRIDSNYANFIRTPSTGALKKEVKWVFFLSLILNIGVLCLGYFQILDKIFHLENVSGYYVYFIPLSMISNINYIQLKYILIGTSLTKELNTLSTITTLSYLGLMILLVYIDQVNFKTIIVSTTSIGILSLLYIQKCLQRNGYHLYK